MVTKTRKNIQDLQTATSGVGYVLVSKEYKNCQSKLDFVCPKGHEFQMTWANFWFLKQRCPVCFKEQIKARANINIVREHLQKEGYELLSTEYKNNYSNLHVKCPQGHLYFATWANLKRGTRCLECSRQLRRSTIGGIRQAFQETNEILLTNPDVYQNCYTRFEVKCPKNHTYEITWTNFQQGHRCPKCAHFQSMGEREIIDTFNGFGLKEKNRTLIKPFELDIYFPNQKVAVEYCGLFWHSDKHKRITSGYHRNKLDLCNQQNIRLLTIFEDEWKEHKEICISRINSALGAVQNRVFARQCIAKEITSKKARDFLKQTHLQGSGKCKVAYGLFYKDKLVQVMTFGAPSRAHTTRGKKVLEMKRLAGELNTIIIGGAGKLLKLGLDYAKQNNYDAIKSYCDLRWGTGNLYQKLGFTKTHETKYTPHYTDGYKRFRNQNLAQNKKETGKTELEISQQQGFYKIYDCGHQTWEFEV
jgi:ribosomal protein S27E